MTAVTPPDADLAVAAETPELIKAKIVTETARINWLDLQKFYAAGSVISVSAELDLVEVAFAFSQDDKARVAAWLATGQVERTAEEQAKQWYQAKADLWAVVISPWVLVQDKPLTTQLN